jgi:hypothetical protein
MHLKPRIYFEAGLWFCSGGMTVAHGKTPLLAYKNWKRWNDQP